MPLFQYFGWGQLSSRGVFCCELVLLSAGCTCATSRRSARSEDQHPDSIRIIDGLNAWYSTRVRRWRVKRKPTAELTLAEAKLRPWQSTNLSTHSEMAAIPARACFRPPCSTGQARSRSLRQLREGRQFKIAHACQ